MRQRKDKNKFKIKSNRRLNPKDASKKIRYYAFVYCLYNSKIKDRTKH